MSYGKTDTSQTQKDVKTAGKGPKPELCQARNFGKKCKSCVTVSKLYATGDDDDKEKAGQCKAKANFYMSVYHIKEKTAKIFASNITIWRSLMQLLPNPNDPDDENIDYTNIKKPYPVLIKRVGSGRNTKYTVSLSPKPTKFPKKYMKKPPFDLDKIFDMIEEDEMDLLDLPPDKTTKVLIFPPWSKDAKVPYKEVFFHWNTNLLEEGAGMKGDDEDFDDDDDLEDDEGDFDDDDEDFDDDDEDEDDDDEDDDEDEDDEDDDAYVPDFSDMNRKELIEVVKKEKLKVKKTKKKDIKLAKLRKLVEKKWREKNDVPL
jgi:hypothetical protein